MLKPAEGTLASIGFEHAFAKESLMKTYLHLSGCALP